MSSCSAYMCNLPRGFLSANSELVIKLGLAMSLKWPSSLKHAKARSINSLFDLELSTKSTPAPPDASSICSQYRMSPVPNKISIPQCFSNLFLLKTLEVAKTLLAPNFFKATWLADGPIPPTAVSMSTLFPAKFASCMIASAVQNTTGAQEASITLMVEGNFATKLAFVLTRLDKQLDPRPITYAFSSISFSLHCTTRPENSDPIFSSRCIPKTISASRMFSALA